ncbi:GNAT family N-acetyltransferase [Alicyclobacillus herbarius]|uniref:GNAT family N-acetyltransferase n=1 Tax=Alicyclobacillus herbarius TaxID=122960 RepID=UPI000688EC2D|nr:GNAT family N-acetyltransferase [Alicyclobacillus herbarius]
MENHGTVTGLEEIRRLRREELTQHLTLDEFAFQFQFDPETRQQILHEVDAATILGCFIDGELVAQAQVLPLTAYVAGTPYAMGGVASVATWPEYRRGGKVARLLRRALLEMREAGQTLSMLAPFSFAFYRKYGWEMLMERRLYTLSEREWPRFPDTGGRLERTTDWQRLSRIYEAYARRYTGMLSRTEHWWEQRIARRKPGQRAVYINASGAETGYILYQVQQNVLTVHELVFLDEDARRGLWNFIANHDSMAREAKLVAPLDDTLPYLLDNPRITQELEPYFMARIVDVEAFLQTYPFVPVDEAWRLLFSVTDTYAPWNEAGFQVQWRDLANSSEKVCVHRMDGQAVGIQAQTTRGSSGELIVDVDIQDLTAMLMGYQRPVRLWQMGRLHCDERAVALLERVVPQQTPYLLDFF